MARPEVQAAFALIASLGYRKQWDMSGPCIVVREEWLDGDEVVQTREHSYSVDNPPPPEPEAAASNADAPDDGDETAKEGN